MNTTITEVYEELKECYSFIDYRCAYFKEKNDWISIISTFRFSNETFEAIDGYHDRLRKLCHNTDLFKIEFEILKLEEWKTKWETLKKDAYYLDVDFELNSLRPLINLENNSHSPLTEFDRDYNSIQFNISSYQYKNHHKRFGSLGEKKQLKSIGITSIYPMIEQALEINFNHHLQISSLFLFPIYFKIKNANYSNKSLIGEIYFHKVFYNTRLIIKHYLHGKEKGIIKRFLLEGEIIPNQDYLKFQFEISVDEDLYHIEKNISEFVFYTYFEPLDIKISEFRKYANNSEFKYEFDFMKKNYKVSEILKKPKNRKNIRYKYSGINGVTEFEYKTELDWFKNPRIMKDFIDSSGMKFDNDSRDWYGFVPNTNIPSIIRKTEYYVKKGYTTHKEVDNYVNNINRKYKEIDYEFDFAFSYAREDRETVKKLYNSLVRRGFRVFYDKPFEWDLVGKDLSNRFKDVFGRKSKYVIIFVSEKYKVKDWANFEFQYARDEAKKRKEEFIIPIKLDNTILYGLKNTIGYFNYHQKGTRKISNLLSRKLEDFNKRHNIP